MNRNACHHCHMGSVKPSADFGPLPTGAGGWAAALVGGHDGNFDRGY